jgi:nucleoside-diphosphate-sugar epimerase
MKVLVTGVSGRFAPHLVRDLLDHDHEVVLFSRKKPADEFQSLEWIEGDCNIFEDCLLAMKGRHFDAIQHAAAKPGPTDTRGGQGFDDPAVFPLTMQTNIMGLYFMLQAALRTDVGIFVQTGSNCALGHGFRFSGRPFAIKYLPIDEEHPCDPEDSYSFSKLTGERLLESYALAYGLRCYALRSAGITDEARRMNMARSAKIQNGWSEWMHPWIASEDLASAHRLLMEKAGSIESFGTYFCNNDDTDMLEPTLDFIGCFRPDLLPLVRDDLSGHNTLLSNKKLKDAVGWKPEKSWRQYL